MTEWHPEEDALADDHIKMILLSPDEAGGVSVPFPASALHWEYKSIEITERKWLGLRKVTTVHHRVGLYHGDVLVRRWIDLAPYLLCYFETNNRISISDNDHLFMKNYFFGNGVQWSRR